MSDAPSIASILLVDPYNDVLRAGGEVWPRAKAAAERVNHPSAVAKVSRDKGLTDLRARYRRPTS